MSLHDNAHSIISWTQQSSMNGASSSTRHVAASFELSQYFEPRL